MGPLDPMLSALIAEEPRRLHLQRHRPSNSSHGELTVETPCRVVGGDCGRAVRHHGVVVDVERVLGERAPVPARVAGVHRGRPGR